jgi:hypothetical protein
MNIAFVMYNADLVRKEAMEALAKELPKFVRQAVGDDVQVEARAMAYQLGGAPNELAAFGTEVHEGCGGPVEVAVLVPSLGNKDPEVVRRHIAFSISRGSWIPAKLCFDSHVWLHTGGGFTGSSPIIQRTH